MQKGAPRFYIATGDTYYYDHPNASPDMWATTVQEMRAKWHRQFAVPSFRAALASAPVFFMKDDHDFRSDDADNTGSRAPSPGDGRRIFNEQVGHRAIEACPIERCG